VKLSKVTLCPILFWSTTVQDEENKANDVSQEWDYSKKNKNEILVRKENKLSKINTKVV
jgi:hypothetical protein